MSTTLVYTKVSELAVKFYRCGAISLRRIFHRLEHTQIPALAIDPDVSLPLFAPWTYPLGVFVVLTASSVGVVLRTSGQPQIVPLVVCAVAILMVYLWHVVASHYFPYDAVQSILHIAKSALKPAVANGAGHITSVLCVPYLPRPFIEKVFSWPVAPSDYTAIRRVVEALDKVFAFWQWFGSHLIFLRKVMVRGDGGSCKSAVTPLYQLTLL